MSVADPKAWVANVQRLYRAKDAAAVEALYTSDAHTRFGSTILRPEWVHAHPDEWFGSLDNYEITKSFRASHGDIIVSETIASYVTKVDGMQHREFGVDIYWVNDEGMIYHKHTIEVVQPLVEQDLSDVITTCSAHDPDLSDALQVSAEALERSPDE